ncbi:glycoside hydrolase family 26 protein [Anaeromicrobium sediminis]|uniref:Endoglucanase n=1 Tax=Anaeromicrobium sediminis TaxID=1478221 RepID=A0A267MGB8_9FIRM|nr:glycosyl hydrolase [Anaeromicrobium sediminis]PAB58619.1 endoglucanase [Anaeromicrobium sediminis]
MNFRRVFFILCLFILSILAIFSFIYYTNKYVKYTNPKEGYTLKYPDDMDIHNSFGHIKTIIANEDVEIEIYYDNFKNTVSSPLAYMNYSNKFLKNNKDHIKELEKTTYVNGKRTHLLKWKRSKLTKVQNDKNYYVSAEIINNKYEVYTIFIKSSKPFKTSRDYMNIIRSFKISDKNEHMNNASTNISFKNKNKILNEEAISFFKEYFLENNGLKWGIYENTAPKDFDFLNALEKKLNYSFKFLVKYQCFSSGGFPMEEMVNAHNNNRHVVLTLQTMHLDGTDNSSVMYDILKGKYDIFLNSYAKDIKSFKHPIMFRLNNEMNGDWCSYSSYYYSKDPDIFKEVWKYVYRIFQSNGVDNVLWVWNPHDISFPGFKWNHYLNYYPGDEYVDIVGLTGYNTGTYYRGEKWRGFNEIYIPIYNDYMKHFKKPFMITEFGSNSVGGNKEEWINEMFSSIKEFKNIKIAIWWNGIDWDSNMNPARIYRLDQNENIIHLFKDGLKDYK